MLSARTYYTDEGIPVAEDVQSGHAFNPATGQPYAPQPVLRGDFTRVLAEYWADGPDSETPPGHWFTLLNYVNDQPELQRRWRGVGEVVGIFGLGHRIVFYLRRCHA